MSRQPIVEIVRRETFSSAHRLHSPALSAEQNLRIFGKCNNPNGHGHNYTVFTKVRGPVDPDTGMVMNLTDLKFIMRQVIDVVDHKHLDNDVPYFSTHTSTGENIAVWFYDQVTTLLRNLGERHPPSDKRQKREETEHLRLIEIRLVETENNEVIYGGEQA